MTTQTKHTAGPWHVKPPRGNLTAWSIESENRQVAWVAQIMESNSQEDANARLIAAAPELFEALQRLATVVANQDLTTTRIGEVEALGQYLAQARAALAKARGEQS